MSACNQCLKVPCECMDDRAELLRGEFPGWSVDAESRESFWMWRGDGPKPGTAQRVLVYSNGVYIGLGDDAPRWQAPDMLTAAEHATGETRLSRRAKAEAVHLCCFTGCAKPATFRVGDYTESCTAHVADLRAEGDAVRPIALLAAKPETGTDAPRPRAPSAEALRAKGAAEAFCAEWTRKLQAAYPTDGWEPVVRQTVDKSHFYAADPFTLPGYVELIVDDGSGDSIIPLYVAPGQMRWYATKDGDYVGDAFKTPLDALRAVDAVRPAAKSAGEVEERDFHKLSVILEKHVADLRAAFPDREWSFSVGRDLAASCIHENEFGNAPYPPSYIQWRNGWFAGTEDDPETKTYTTPVDAFRALLTQPQPAAPRKNFATKPRHSLIPPHVLARHVLPVLHDGAQKHGRDHWQRCSTRDYADAAMTHIQAFLDGDVMDESGRHALAHAAADLLLGLGVMES